jgi:sugar O-acyltransferase (sialic acid O-acetyltransferase NeuD family)
MRRCVRGVFGASGHGRETMAWLDVVADTSVEYVFVDDAATLPDRINDRPVYRFEQFLGVSCDVKELVIAIGDPQIRRRLADRSRTAGLPFFTAIAPTAVVGPHVTIGPGSIISHLALITSNVTVGAHVHLNMQGCLAHDCVVDDYVTIGPGAGCNGNVHLCEGSYLGAKSVIRQGRPGQPVVIGREAVVGMGSVVLRDVPPSVKVVGNPARPR